MTSLAFVAPPPAPLIPHEQVSIEDALRAVFADLKPNTLRTYEQGWDAFARFLGCMSIGDAARALFTAPHGQANLTAMRFRTHLLGHAPKFSAGTIRTYMGALAGVTKRMRRLGIVSWKLEVEQVGAAVSRDTSGPGTAAIEKMIASLAADTALNCRNAAIIELLYNPALRRSEVVGLDLDDIDFDRSRLAVKGKGRDEKEFVPLPPPAANALHRWIVHRGQEAGALFHNLDSVYDRKRLSDVSVYKVVARVSASVGIETHPHALRHSGGTDAARATNGDMQAVNAFLRHKKLDTSKVYVDNWKDAAGTASRKIAAMRGG